MDYQDFPRLLFDSNTDPFVKDRLKSHFSALLAVAKVDGNLNRQEIDFLNEITQNLGLTEDEIRDAIKDPQSPLPPLSTRDKVKNLVEIAMMVAIDGAIDPRELKLCAIIAERYGLKESKMNIISANANSGECEHPIPIESEQSIPV